MRAFVMVTGPLTISNLPASSPGNTLGHGKSMERTFTPRSFESSAKKSLLKPCCCPFSRKSNGANCISVPTTSSPAFLTFANWSSACAETAVATSAATSRRPFHFEKKFIVELPWLKVHPAWARVRTGAPTCMWCDSVYTVNLRCQACQKYFSPHHFKAYRFRENAGLRSANWRYIQTLDLDFGRRLRLIHRRLR